MPRRDWLWDLLPITLYVAAVLAIGPWAETGLNDDWVYAKDALDTARDGRYRVSGLESAWGVPQVLLGAALVRALGFSHAVLRGVGVASTLAAAAGLAACLRRAAVPGPARALAAGVFLFTPAVFIASQSFMTDAPFLALLVWAGYALERGRAGRSLAWTAAGTALAIAATAQRQFGVVLPLAAIAVALLDRRRTGGEGEEAEEARRFGRNFALVAALALVGFDAIRHWWQALGAWSPPPSKVAEAGYARRVLTSFFADAGLNLGLLALPLFAAADAARARRWLAPRVLAPVGAALAAGAALGYRFEWAGIGNQVSAWGVFQVNEVLVGLREEVLPRSGILAATALGAIGFAGILAASLRAGSLTVVEAAGALYLLLVVAIRDFVFDRYLLPAIPAVLLLLARETAPSRRRLALGAALAAALAAFSITTQHDYMRWTEARVAATRWAVAHGVAPGDLVGGYEWDGWHRAPLFPPTPDRMHWGAPWLASLEPGANRFALSFSPIPGATVVKEFPYASIWRRERPSIFVLELARRRERVEDVEGRPRSN